MTYDQKSRDLAEFFLSDGGRDPIDAASAHELAQRIQAAIEDYFAEIDPAQGDSKERTP